MKKEESFKGEFMTTYSANKTFSAATVGYGVQTSHNVTVNNTGNQATGSLNVTLSGSNASGFTLSRTSISSINVGGSSSFTIAPRTGLAAGTYTATVTVSGGASITSHSFTVSFTVNSASSNTTTPVVTRNTPRITVASTTENTISFAVVYPDSNAWGNRLEIWNSVTGEWREIQPSMQMRDGNYTFNGLSSSTSYMGRLTWFENGTWRVQDIHVTTSTSAPANNSNTTPTPTITTPQPSAKIEAVSTNRDSVTFRVSYPDSNAWGNRLELWNSVTGQWFEIQPSMQMRDGQYSFTGLSSSTTYMGRLTYYDNAWKVVDIWVTTS